MKLSYNEMQEFLSDNGITHEEMQSRWDNLKETNRIVKNLSDHGQTWTDLNVQLLNSLIKLTNKKEQE